LVLVQFDFNNNVGAGPSACLFSGDHRGSSLQIFAKLNHSFLC
jgi:hypothetical protein